MIIIWGSVAGFKVDNIVSSIKETLSILHQKLPAQAEKHLKKIDGKWAKYSLADVRKQDKKSADQLQCAIDAYKKYSKDDKAKHQISSVYKKHPFIIIDKEVKSQNGNFGYDVSGAPILPGPRSATCRETMAAA